MASSVHIAFTLGKRRSVTAVALITRSLTESLYAPGPSLGLRAFKSARIFSSASISTAVPASRRQRKDMSSRQRARFAAVIPAADPQRRLLSFANLCELHVLSAIRRAFALHRRTADWRAVQRHAMGLRFDWARAATDYLRVYQQAAIHS